jgi:cytochrome c oxidase subunit 4
MDNKEHNNEHEHQHITPYSTYVIVWLALLALTSITVTIAGISLGAYTLAVALFIAAVKSYLVINIFMHIKYEEKIFKVFLVLSGLTLVVIFALTFFDFTYR